MQTFAQIKAAVDAGAIVHWMDDNYVVFRQPWGSYEVMCVHNKHCVGLYEPDYTPADFYIEQEVFA